MYRRLNQSFFLLSFFQMALIHLGAKYAPCMRWDEALDREIKEHRLKERDTACCIVKEHAGCVQSPKAQCTKVGEGEGGFTPRSNTVRSTTRSFVPSVRPSVCLFVTHPMWQAGRQAGRACVELKIHVPRYDKIGKTREKAWSVPSVSNEWCTKSVYV